VEIRREASKLIAKLSDGALRDAISILDQCISLGSKELTYEDVLSVVGLVTDTFIAEVVDAIKNKEVGRVLNAVDELVMEGKNIGQFVSELVMYYRNLMICSSVSNPEDIIDASADSIQRMKEQCKGLELFEIVTVIKELSSLEAALKWSTHPRVLLETTLIKLCETGWTREMPGYWRESGCLRRMLMIFWKRVLPYPKMVLTVRAVLKGFRKCGFG